NTELILTFSGITEFEALHPERESHCWRPTVTLPVYIDNEDPAITNRGMDIWKTEDNRIMFSATVYDNHYVMAAWPVQIVVDYNGNPTSVGEDLSDVQPVFAQEKGASTLLTWDITDKINYIDSKYIGVAIYDYALNQSVIIIDDVVIPQLPDPTKLVLNKDSINIGVKQSQKLSATLLPLNFGLQNEYKIVWSIVDTNIAKINKTGRVTAVSEGTTTAIATAMWVDAAGKPQQLQAYCEVKVKPEPKEIKVNDITLKIGEVSEINIDFGEGDIYTPMGTILIAPKDPNQTSVYLQEGAIKGLAKGETILDITYTYVNGFGKDVVLATEAKVTVSEEVYDSVYVPRYIIATYGENNEQLWSPFEIKVGERVEFTIVATPWYASNEVNCYVGVILAGDQDCATFEGTTFVGNKPGEGIFFIESKYDEWAYIACIFTVVDPNAGGEEEVIPPPVKEEFVVSEKGVLEEYNGVGGDIVIPNSVVEIANKVFQNKKITSVVFPAGLKKIGQFAFDSNYELKVLNLPEGLTNIEVAAFARCALTSFTMPNSLLHIGELAFANNDLVYDKLVLNEGLTYVGKNAFMGAKVNVITIPSTLVGVDFGTNQMTDNLTVKYEIDEKNAKFIQTEDAIIDIYGNYLRYTGENILQTTIVNIPEGIVRIGAGAFYKGDSCNIAMINVPASVKAIGDYAFYGYIAIVNFAGDAPILESEDDQPEYGYSNFFILTNVYYKKGATGFDTMNWNAQLWVFGELDGNNDLAVYSIYSELLTVEENEETKTIENAVLVSGFAEPWAEGFTVYRIITAKFGEPITGSIAMPINEFERIKLNGKTDIISEIIFAKDYNLEYN
ncbi:MAG: leucine-rich repeat protein, partial [Clostridia bacterium]